MSGRPQLWCSRCKSYRDLAEFGSGTGRQRYWCRACNTAYDRERRRRRPTGLVAAPTRVVQAVHITAACQQCMDAHAGGHRCTRCGSTPADGPFPEDQCPRCEPRL